MFGDNFEATKCLLQFIGEVIMLEIYVLGSNPVDDKESHESRSVFELKLRV